MSKKVLIYLVVGLVAYGGFMLYKKNQKMKLADIKK